MTITREVQLSSGTIRYRDVGDGPVVVFVHGLLVNGSTWRKVAEHLSKGFRCIVPDWPLGSHPVAMNPAADLSPHGVAQIVGGFLDALGLEDVTLVGNDSGGAISQIVAARHPRRLGRLVLTTCDAFEIFPPKLFAYLKYVTYVPGVLAVLGKSMLVAPALQRLPMSYGAVSKYPIAREVLEGWIRPAAEDSNVRRDLRKVLRGISPSVTMEIAKELPRFHKPVLLAWAPEDRFFPITLAERLRASFPNAQLAKIDDAFVFAQEDQPAEVARLIESFCAKTKPLNALA
jgi:pimeloyl-ACP methyl ester carboxylesterase